MSYARHLNDLTKSEKERAQRLEEQIKSMREAIKEAHEALLRVSECKVFYAESMDIDSYTTKDCVAALAKLQHFLKPWSPQETPTPLKQFNL